MRSLIKREKYLGWRIESWQGEYGWRIVSPAGELNGTAFPSVDAAEKRISHLLTGDLFMEEVIQRENRRAAIQGAREDAWRQGGES